MSATREFWVWQWNDGEYDDVWYDMASDFHGWAGGHPVQLVPIGDAAKYLKEGETVEECIARNRFDADAVLGLLESEKVRADRLQSELEAAQKDAALDGLFVNAMREFYLGYLSQHLPINAFERVRRVTVTDSAIRVLRNVRSEHAAIAAQEK